MARDRKGQTPTSSPAVRRRVLVVDDSAPMREQVARLLGPEKDLIVVALMPDAESLLDGWASWRPDVIVLDISLPGCSGLEAARRLRVAACPAPIVFLSIHQEPEIVRAAWAAGGCGYVAKRDVGRGLIPALRAALDGPRSSSSTAKSR